MSGPFMLDIPDEIVRALETKVPADQVEAVICRALVTGFYIGEELPLDKAAQLARMDESVLQALVEA